MARVKMQKRKEARALRKKGLSIRKIAKQINVAKSSVSNWVRDIELTKEQKEELSANASLAQYEAIQKINSKRSKEAEKRRAQNENIGAKMIGSINERDLLLLGVGLYWGEGSKTRGNFSICNSDYKMINIALEWFELFDIKPDKIRFRVQIPETFNSDECQEYWSSKVNIAKDKIKMQKIPAKSKRIKEGYYGVMSISISSRPKWDILMGMINSL